VIYRIDDRDSPSASIFRYITFFLSAVEKSLDLLTSSTRDTKNVDRKRRSSVEEEICRIFVRRDHRKTTIKIIEDLCHGVSKEFRNLKHSSMF
jgi:hypothetical protein